MDNIINLSEKMNDSRFVDPLNALRETADQIERGELSCKKCIILLLDDEKDEKYDRCMRVAKMKTSECVALLAVWIRELTEEL